MKHLVDAEKIGGVSYQCEYCGKCWGTKSITAECEEICREKREEHKRRLAEFQQNIADRMQQAKAIAINDPAIKLLCERGLDRDARELCVRKTKALWDCNTARGWEDVYNAMIRAAKERVEQEQTWLVDLATPDQ